MTMATEEKGMCISAGEHSHLGPARLVARLLFHDP